MTKLNKKGFTIVELVIVIAVIAILAAVLIPTFSNVIEKANTSSALSEAKNAMTDDLANAEADYENMDDYKSADGKTQYYVVRSYKGDASKELDTNDYTVANSVVTKVTGESGAKQVEGTTYYELGEFAGTYANGKYTYETDKGYTCEYDTVKGEWTVTKTESPAVSP